MQTAEGANKARAAFSAKKNVLSCRNMVTLMEKTLNSVEYNHKCELRVRTAASPAAKQR